MEWLASALVAARARLDVATNNLANVSSEGFRKTYAEVSATRSGVRVDTARDRAQGPLVRTGQPFDLAISGQGAFRVRGADQRILTTRSGHFMRDPQQRLIDDQGRALIGAAGHPIVVSARAQVRADGSIADGGRVVDHLVLPKGSRVSAGFLERPNVDAIGEMVEVLQAQRSFETVQHVFATLDQTRVKAANDVAQLK